MELMENQMTVNHGNGMKTVPIFKLDIDCFEEIFDWLSLKDLYALCETCKRLQTVAGLYFQQNFASIEVQCEEDGISVLNRSFRIDAFSPFIRKLCIYGNLNCYKYVAANCKSLKELQLFGNTLTTKKIECIKEILTSIDALHFHGGQIDGHFYEQFLTFCPHLKRLSVQNLKINSPSEHDWLNRNYPKLEHFELFIDDKNIQINELLAFFKQNQQLKSFTTNANYLLNNDFHQLMNNGGQTTIDDLIVVQDFNEDELEHSVCHMLNALHRIGFYKRLHLNGTMAYFFQESINQIATLDALETLRCGCFLTPMSSVDLSSLKRLKELSVYYYSQSNDEMISMAKGLVNLERISFTQATLNDIVPFVIYAAKLCTIQVHHVMRASSENGFQSNGNDYCSDNILYAATLNKRRKQLKNAKKLTIFLSENVYLATKWNICNVYFSLIRIKRIN